MLVLLPVYDRFEILSIVIKSIISDFDKINDGRVILLIVNNNKDLEARKKFNRIINEIDIFNGNFAIQVIHREYDLSPIESWYDAVKTHAKWNELILMMGDDDLNVRNGILKRFNISRRFNCDFLLCKFLDRIYFFQNNKQFWFSSVSVKNDSKIKNKIFNFIGPNGVEPSFISNHTFVNNNLFWKAYDRATFIVKRHEQIGVPKYLAEAPVPLYLPFIIKNEGGIVYESDCSPVVRGGIVEDIIYRQYSGGGNTALFSLLGLHAIENYIVLSNESHSLLRKRFHVSISRNLVDLFTTKDVSIGIIYKLLRTSNFSWLELLPFNLFYNIISFIKIFVKPGYKLRKVKNKTDYDYIENFLKENGTD